MCPYHAAEVLLQEQTKKVSIDPLALIAWLFGPPDSGASVNEQPVLYRGRGVWGCCLLAGTTSWLGNGTSVEGRRDSHLQRKEQVDEPLKDKLVPCGHDEERHGTKLCSNPRRLPGFT